MVALVERLRCGICSHFFNDIYIAKLLFCLMNLCTNLFNFFQLLKVILIGSPRGGFQQDNTDSMEAEMEVCSALPITPEALSELGQLVLGCDTICQAIVTTLLK